MKVTDFVIDFCRSRCSIYWLWPNQIRTFSDLGCSLLYCVAIISVGLSVMEQCSNSTAVV